MIFLLIHKQNKIIKLRYELQQLHEQKDALLQQKKGLTLAYHKGQQLSSIQSFAKNNLSMNAIKLNDVKTINVSPAKTNTQDQQSSTQTANDKQKGNA